MHSGDYGTVNWRRFMGVAFVAIVIIGLYSIGEGLSLKAQADAQRSWPTAEGVVLASQVNVTTESDGTYYSPYVLYQYEVDGAVLRSDRLSYVAESSTEVSWASAVVGRYPVGANVTVHYDPGDPNFALLELGTGDAEWIPLTVGAVFTTVGTLGAVWVVISKAEWQ